MSAGWAAAGQVAGELASTGMQAFFNAAEAKKARSFAKKMYKHRYQYAMEDMRQAGLNPILVASGGLSGSTGSVPSAQIGKPNLGQAATAYTQMKVQNAQTKLLNAQARKAEMEANAIESSGLGVTTFPGRLGHSAGTILKRLWGDYGRPTWDRLPDDAGFWEYMTGTPTTSRGQPSTAKKKRDADRARAAGVARDAKKYRFERPTRGY